MLAYALALQGLLLALGGAMHVQAAGLPERCSAFRPMMAVAAPALPTDKAITPSAALSAARAATPGGPLPAAAVLSDRAFRRRSI